MTVDDVCVWLLTVSPKLQAHLPSFRAEQVNGIMLQFVTREVLNELGVTSGLLCAKIMSAITSLNTLGLNTLEYPATAPPPPPPPLLPSQFQHTHLRIIHSHIPLSISLRRILTRAPFHITSISSITLIELICNNNTNNNTNTNTKTKTKTNTNTNTNNTNTNASIINNSNTTNNTNNNTNATPCVPSQTRGFFIRWWLAMATPTSTAPSLSGWPYTTPPRSLRHP